MIKKKIIILGIDCLDYHLVHRWQLDSYILDSYGYYFVGYDLYTPIIWAKFLTGIDVTEHGFSSKYISRIKRIKGLYYIHFLVNYLINPLNKLFQNNFLYKHGKTQTTILLPKLEKIFLKIVTGYSVSLTLHERILLKLFIKATYSECLPRKLFKKTIIYAALQKGLKALPIEFPPINDHMYRLIRNMLYFYVDVPTKERLMFLSYVWNITKNTLSILNRNLDNYDLILWYTPYIDVASHMFYRPRNLKYMVKLYSVYNRLGKEIERSISKIYDDAVILIISDHGYNPTRQDHSYFGYWSANIKIYKKPTTILDFAPLIKGFIKG